MKMTECCKENLIENTKNYFYQLQMMKTKIKWKNEKPCHNKSYIPTFLEHIANIMSHAIFIVPAANCFLELTKRAPNNQKLIAAVIYGSSLFLVVTISTLFHCAHYYFCQGQCLAIKHILHRCDRSVIYFFIFGTFFPWLYTEILQPHEKFEKIRTTLCIMVMCGVIYEQLYYQKYKILEITFYVMTGLIPSIALHGSGLFTKVPELKTGALMYVIGLFFYKCDGLVPCAHAIWHACSGAGAMIHYYAVLKHLYPEPMEYFSQI